MLKVLLGTIDAFVLKSASTLNSCSTIFTKICPKITMVLTMVLCF